MPNVDTLLRDHVTLQVDCIDRLYLNGYVPFFNAREKCRCSSGLGTCGGTS